MSTFYELEYGIPSLINCIGTLTSLGGSRMDERVTSAIVQASRSFVDLNELQKRAGKRIADLCRVPDGYTGYVTAGAAAGLCLSTAACMTENDSTRIRQLPNTSNISKKYVILDRGGDMRWNQSIQTSGAQLLFVGSKKHPATYSDLLSVLIDRSHEIACMVYFAGAYDDGQGLSFEDILVLTNSHNIRLIVDASAQLPPRSNLYKWTHGGADIVLYSGGKGIGGPQTSGLLLGKSDLVASVAANGSPHELAIGRPMKTSKESICGLVKALEIFIQDDDADDVTHYNLVISIITDTVCDIPGISALRVVCPLPPTIQPNTIPRLYIDITVKRNASPPLDHSLKSEFYGDDLDHGDPLAIQPTTPVNILAYKLLKLQPPIAVNTSNTGIVINPQTLTVREAKIVAQGVKHVIANMVRDGILTAKVTSRL